MWDNGWPSPYMLMCYLDWQHYALWYFALFIWCVWPQGFSPNTIRGYSRISAVGNYHCPLADITNNVLCHIKSLGPFTPSGKKTERKKNNSPHYYKKNLPLLYLPHCIWQCYYNMITYSTCNYNLFGVHSAVIFSSERNHAIGHCVDSTGLKTIFAHFMIHGLELPPSLQATDGL